MIDKILDMIKRGKRQCQGTGQNLGVCTKKLGTKAGSLNRNDSAKTVQK